MEVIDDPSWVWGRARRLLRVNAVIVYAPTAAFGVALVLLAGISWLALVSGLALGLFFIALPIALSAMALGIRPPLDQLKTARVVPPLAGVLFELARLGLVSLLDADVGEAVWLGFGETLMSLFIGFAATGLFALARPPAFDEDKAAAGRAHPIFYMVKLLWLGDPLLRIGFSLLVAYSPWLVLVTMPVYAALIATSDKEREVEIATLLLGMVATIAGLVLLT